MKNYVKPEMEISELRPEERFAGGSGSYEISTDSMVPWIIHGLTKLGIYRV